MKKKWKGNHILLAALAIQVFFTFFFISQIIISIFGLRTRPIPWNVHELMEVGAALGLLLGIVLGTVALRSAIKRTYRAEEKLRVASGAFMELLEERFGEWRLTPAERDVALFVIKGLSTQEISGLRATSEGTVKAQTNAIYRKAQVSGRTQLLSQFIDDLINDPLTQ